LTGHVQHEPRFEPGKNLLAEGAVIMDEVVQMIKRCGGKCHQTSPHHVLPSVDVHILRPKGRYDGYYIKFYFIEPDIIFISVHM
jgi:hypothetical protein